MNDKKVIYVPYTDFLGEKVSEWARAHNSIAAQKKDEANAKNAILEYVQPVEDACYVLTGKGENIAVQLVALHENIGSVKSSDKDEFDALTVEINALKERLGALEEKRDALINYKSVLNGYKITGAVSGERVKSSGAKKQAKK